MIENNKPRKTTYKNKVLKKNQAARIFKVSQK